MPSRSKRPSRFESPSRNPAAGVGETGLTPDASPTRELETRIEMLAKLHATLRTVQRRRVTEQS